MRFLMIVPVFLLSWQATNSTAGVSVLPPAVSDAEMARLPDFCVVRMKMPWGSPESRAWVSKIGENFGDFFHYCEGLNYINRYWAARSAKERTYYLQRAEANFTYIVRAIKPDFTMGAELFTNRGEVFKLKGEPGYAIKDLRQAISIEPTFVKAYLQLADVYSGSRDRTHALETISEGLRNIPDSKTLQRKYLELGGKEPFPDPIVKKETTPEPPARRAAEPPQADTVIPPTPPVAVGAKPETKTESPQTVGTPKNPYCRFCPPE